MISVLWRLINLKDYFKFRREIACKDKCPQPLGQCSSCSHYNFLIPLSFIPIFFIFFYYFEVSKRDPETLIKATCLLTFYYPPTHHNPFFFFFFHLLCGSHSAHTAGSLLNLPQPATSTSSFPFITLVNRNGFITFSLSSQTPFPSSNLCFASLSRSLHPWMTLSSTPLSASRPSFPTNFTRSGPNRSTPVRPGLRAATRRTSSPA